MSILNPFVMKPHCWGILVDYYTETFQVVLLFETLSLHHFKQVFPRLFAGNPFSPTLSQSEGTVIAVLLSIVVNGLSYVVTSLKSISHLVHLFHLVHLMPCWPSSSTMFVALTLIVLVTPKSYLCELTVIVHGPLGHLLLSVTTPCQERKSIARLVNFLLTSESVQSKPYSIGEVCLKVGLPG
jgi:hypothetical protein